MSSSLGALEACLDFAPHSLGSSHQADAPSLPQVPHWGFLTKHSRVGVGARGNPGIPEAGAEPPGTQEEGRAPQHTLGGSHPPPLPKEP